MNKHGWTYKKLEDVCDFSRGLTYKGKDEVDYSSNVVLRSNNVDLATYTLNFDDLKYIAEDITIPEDKFIKKNSLLICMSNGSKQHLGKVAFIDRDYPYAFGGFMGLIKPIETEIFPKYVYYYCCSPKYKSFLHTIGNGANINNLRFSDIGKNQLPVPPMEEQEAIVAELDEINEAISALQQQVADLDTLAQSTFYDMFGDPEKNPFGFLKYPLSELCLLKAGKAIKANQLSDKKENRYPCYGGNGVRGFIDTYSHSGIYPIIGRQGALCGNINLAQGQFYATEHAVVASPIKEMNAMWLYFALQFMHLEKYAHGVAQPGLSVKDLNPLIMYYPPLVLQQDFAEKVEAIESAKAEINAQIAEMQTLLASRMDYYFD